ncbi:hypothetical protein BHE90_016833 [Fusarium euwallaceae]|uniref:Uncharacterized protein n=3 Tax=Fusarium solani species complex TaxID=232080 RepID=A0A428U7Q1_9HYPO|nr:hypothetical protein CEP51_011612 [Fusarium floridanum]RSM10337.1 hypothetical protein CEP52_003712 [Fusarium oligoseptatum]RTE68788.1 hypothetical protein BHE90_016833 [Fusarium euwallaceae]
MSEAPRSLVTKLAREDGLSAVGTDYLDHLSTVNGFVLVRARFLSHEAPRFLVLPPLRLRLGNEPNPALSFSITTAYGTSWSPSPISLGVLQWNSSFTHDLSATTDGFVRARALTSVISLASSHGFGFKRLHALSLLVHCPAIFIAHSPVTRSVDPSAFLLPASSLEVVGDWASRPSCPFDSGDPHTSLDAAQLLYGDLGCPPSLTTAAVHLFPKHTS